jgi:hypothetical protein
VHRSLRLQVVRRHTCTLDPIIVSSFRRSRKPAPHELALKRGVLAYVHMCRGCWHPFTCAGDVGIRSHVPGMLASVHTVKGVCCYAADVSKYRPTDFVACTELAWARAKMMAMMHVRLARATVGITCALPVLLWGSPAPCPCYGGDHLLLARATVGITCALPRATVGITCSLPVLLWGHCCAIYKSCSDRWRCVPLHQNIAGLAMGTSASKCRPTAVVLHLS